MGIEIITMEDCASNYGVFDVPGSKPGTSYTVTLHGSEQAPHCTCPAFMYSKDQDCKHVKRVWQDACLFNPQWKDGKTDPALRPREYGYHTFSTHPCPCCGGKMVYVKRAV